MTKARNLADLLNADGQIDNADIVDNTISNAKLAQTPNFRNIIINGDMSIAQRGTSVNVGDGDSGYHTVDRWRFSESGSPTAVFTMSQDTDVPTGQGFATSLKMDCATADTSLAAADVLRIEQRVEGQNLQYLKKGTSNAESLTVSFWVKSNKTGTYTCEIFDNDNNRQNGKTYTIDSANTWEKKTITYDGDTTGAFGNDNGTSFLISFFLGAGTEWTSGTFSNGTWEALTKANRVSSSQVNLADNTANNFWITGVQLEAGTTASDFEFLPVDMNLQRCNRYYQDYTEFNTIVRGYGYNVTSGMDTPFTFKTPMRAAPTMTEVSGSDGGSATTLTSFGNIKTYGCDFNTDPTTSNQDNFYAFKFTASAEL